MLPEALPLLTAAGSLAGVIAFILGAQHLLRRTRLAPRHDPGRRLAIVETLAVDPRRRLLLVACQGRRFLLLVGGAGDVLLDSWNEGAA